MAGKERGFDTLSQFLTRLEREEEYHSITAEVDPYLEAPQIAIRALLEGRKALLFENVKGSRFPLTMNFLASDRRVEIALAANPEELGHQILNVAEQLMPPKPRNIWNAAKPLLPRALGLRVKRTSPEEPRHHFESPDLSKLPILQTWPDDAGKFITSPEALDIYRRTNKRNIGMYRMQIMGAAMTGMHWQIQKGGRFHYFSAEQMNRPLEVAVAIGTDPALLMSAVAPLPEGIDEVLFADSARTRNGYDARQIDLDRRADIRRFILRRCPAVSAQMGRTIRRSLRSLLPRC